MKRRFLLAAAASVPWLAGCASPRVEDYAEQRPALDLRDYFNGTLDAWGVFTDRSGKVVGRYYGPPATWESNDGSKVTATQLAVAPASAGNIPLQLVKANPATGNGAMTGVTFIQRVATKGGVAPTTACDAASKGKKEIVKYQADYIIYKAM